MVINGEILASIVNTIAILGVGISVVKKLGGFEVKIETLWDEYIKRKNGEE